MKKLRKMGRLNYTLGFFLIILVFITAVVVFNPNSYRESFNYRQSNPKILRPVVSPTATASATPVPTPKPIVYTGFCQNVPILMYHHIESLDEAARKGQNSLAVDPKIFDSQMAYLTSSGYRTVTVEEFVNAMLGKQKLGKAVVVTLDDGYQDGYTNAYPILAKYNIKGNYLIPTGLLGNPDYMSWDELKRMVDSGVVSAYDHTWSHANIVALSDDKVRFQILTARQQLEERLGIKANIFAYPYGSEDNRTVNILRANGFIAALSTIPGFTQCDSFIMSLHRTRIGNSPLSSYGL